jgi:RNA polymerase sigma-70 factor (ECF subfamily)
MWARRYAGNAHEAEDIAQEALLRAWRHRGALRSGEFFRGWLASIVRNEAARMGARPRPEPTASLDQSAVEDEALVQAATRVDLRTALLRLDTDEQRLLNLRYEHDLTQAAIARHLEMPEGTVKVRLHRARAKLHRALSER